MLSTRNVTILNFRVIMDSISLHIWNFSSSAEILYKGSMLHIILYIAVELNNPVIINNNRRLYYKITNKELYVIICYYS
jgi:hypothetical protein